jgi:hypothetical protein
MDVEISVQEDALDIGVFGPSSLISESEAQDFVGRIVSYMEE